MQRVTHSETAAIHWSGGQPITAPGEHGGTVPCSRAPRPRPPINEKCYTKQNKFLFHRYSVSDLFGLRLGFKQGQSRLLAMTNLANFFLIPFYQLCFLVWISSSGSVPRQLRHNTEDSESIFTAQLKPGEVPVLSKPNGKWKKKKEIKATLCIWLKCSWFDKTTALDTLE